MLARFSEVGRPGILSQNSDMSYSPKSSKGLYKEL